jgi:hypothetical protein
VVHQPDKHHKASYHNTARIAVWQEENKDVQRLALFSFRNLLLLKKQSPLRLCPLNCGHVRAIRPDLTEKKRSVGTSPSAKSYRIRRDRPPNATTSPPSPTIVRQKKDHHELALMRWGLVPGWVKDLKQARKPINTRAETVGACGMFRNALKCRRFLIPADGLYEWKTLGEALPDRVAAKALYPSSPATVE